MGSRYQYAPSSGAASAGPSPAGGRSGQRQRVCGADRADAARRPRSSRACGTIAQPVTSGGRQLHAHASRSRVAAFQRPCQRRAAHSRHLRRPAQSAPNVVPAGTTLRARFDALHPCGFRRALIAQFQAPTAPATSPRSSTPSAFVRGQRDVDCSRTRSFEPPALGAGYQYRPDRCRPRLDASAAGAGVQATPARGARTSRPNGDADCVHPGNSGSVTQTVDARCARQLRLTLADRATRPSACPGESRAARSACQRRRSARSRRPHAVDARVFAPVLAAVLRSPAQGAHTIADLAARMHPATRSTFVDAVSIVARVRGTAAGQRELRSAGRGDGLSRCTERNGRRVDLLGTERACRATAARGPRLAAPTGTQTAFIQNLGSLRPNARSARGQASPLDARRAARLQRAGRRESAAPA